MKRKNLEKAIIMSLLAASVSVPVWADNITQEGGFYNGNVNIDKGMTNEETYTINANISGKPITGIGFNGTFDIGDGNLIINAGENGIAAGWMNNATLNIYAYNVVIDAGKNGIFTSVEDGYAGKVIIGSENRIIKGLTITADGQGIDNKNGNVVIYGSKDSVIDISSTGTEGYKPVGDEERDEYLQDDQAAIGNGYSSGTTGETVIEGGIIKLTADGGSGIINQTEGCSTTINAKDKVIIKSDNLEKIDGGYKNISNAGINNKVGTTTIDAVNGISIDSSNNGIYAADGTVTLNGGILNSVDADRHGIEATGNNTEVILNAQNNNIYAISDTGSTKGISVDNGAFLDIDSTNGYFRIDTNSDNLNESQTSFDGHNFGVFIENAEADIDVNSSFIINSQGTGKTFGIYAGTDGKNQEATIVNVDAGDIDIYVSSEKGSAVGVESNASDTGNNVTTNLFANNNIKINAIGANNSIGANASTSNLTISSVQGNVNINAQGASAVGLSVGGQGYTANIIGVNNLLYGEMLGIDAMLGTANITSNADTDNLGNFVKGDVAAIRSFNNGVVKLNATNSYNTVFGKSYGLMAGYTDILQGGKIELTALGNQVSAGVEGEKFGSGHAIKAVDNGDLEVNVALHATNNDNIINGVIFASGNSVNVDIDHNIISNDTINVGQGSNYIYSSAHGSTDGVSDRSHVVAALYAQNKGQIDITAGEGGINHIETSYTDLDDSETSKDSERTIWAQRGGKVNIEGTTIIKSSNAEDFYDEEGYATNSRGVAITAGSGVALADPDHGYTDANGNKHAFFENGVLADVDKVLGYRSEVNLSYGAGSAIYGDIVSGYGGSVNISTTNENSGLYMEGNALAGNGGKLTLDIGKGGTWFGRADDYGDAGYGEDAQHKQNFYNPVFSDTIYTGGTVDIKMGEGSTWYLTGQSWVSSLDVTKGNGNVTIDMAKFNKGTHGLTISDLKGTTGGDTDVTFVMDLDHNSHSTSDMLYIKSAEGEYDVILNDVIDGMDKISEDNVLRFATVQGGASFNSVTLKDAGLYNLGFEVGHSEYDNTSAEAIDENKGYNGSEVDTNKPGNDNVEGFFDLNKDSEDNTQKIMLMDTTDAADDPNSVQNWYITKVIGEDLSDGGKTVVNMSKVNYSNAVYMDRLNKRLGEARYINTEEDQGMWVRMRHDRIGKDNEFRIMNTMYELGYDEKQECDNGERRVGAAIDYMDGSSEYTGVGGSGDVSRKGIWLYDTWLGDKGHYSDFVAKWGHLSNDFTLYRGGDKITGDFSNNVYSISAEYGRKKDIGNNWYFEPQVQLQYARVTDANYTTSQGTEVSLDAINSLIARAGFRLGKDLGERSTVYFKADLLHEFLGDQDIYATDGTGTMDVTYGNEGTWCDIGFGFATAMSKTSYAYLDVETSLGNDYEETYQINAGLQWSF